MLEPVSDTPRLATGQYRGTGHGPRMVSPMSSRSRRHAPDTGRALRDRLAAFYDGDDPTAGQVRHLLHAEATRLGRNDLRTRLRIDAALAAADHDAYASAADTPEPDYDADLDTVVAALRDGWLGRWDDALAAILAALAALTGSTTEALRLLRVLDDAMRQASPTASDTPGTDPQPPTRQRVHALVDAARPGPRTVACVQRQPHLI